MVDGFCEQLSSDLAQFPEIAVIAYFSTSKFREERPDIRNVGKELSTSHLITGSIYREKKHLRISIQLVNAITGTQLWTQTYERTNPLPV
jgi:TolB-like protein